MGKRQLKCSAWGMPTFNMFGWQKPCYLVADGYADTFKELMDTVAWHEYGTESGNKKCANCMMHSGYETAAVSQTFSGIAGIWATVRAMMSSYQDDDAARQLDDVPPPSSPGTLVQIGAPPAGSQHS